MRIFLCIFCIFLFLSVQIFSQLRLPSVISSGMVLQQNDSVNFWGWGYNGQQVKITGSWDNNTIPEEITEGSRNCENDCTDINKTTEKKQRHIRMVNI